MPSRAHSQSACARPGKTAGKRFAGEGRILQSQLVVQQPSSSPLWLDVCFVST